MSKRKRRLTQKIKAASAAAAKQGLNTMAHPDAAGIDIGAEELVAAVPAGCCQGDTVRTYTSFTSGVEALRDWLLAWGIKTAAIESTGNCWITAYTMPKPCAWQPSAWHAATTGSANLASSFD